jgi:hypothetical protein
MDIEINWKRLEKIRGNIKKTLFNPKKKRSILNRHCPDDIDKGEWKALVKYWKSKEGEVRHHYLRYLAFFTIIIYTIFNSICIVVHHLLILLDP